jgi:hypothetical protein
VREEPPAEKPYVPGWTTQPVSELPVDDLLRCFLALLLTARPAG